MVRSQNDPATEAVAQIDDSHTAAEPNHIGERCSKCHDQDLETLHRSDYDVREQTQIRLTRMYHIISTH